MVTWLWSCPRHRVQWFHHEGYRGAHTGTETGDLWPGMHTHSLTETQRFGCTRTLPSPLLHTHTHTHTNTHSHTQDQGRSIWFNSAHPGARRLPRQRPSVPPDSQEGWVCEQLWAPGVHCGRWHAGVTRGWHHSDSGQQEAMNDDTALGHLKYYYTTLWTYLCT